ncbi:MAG: SAM-dependent methyltransferase [Lachnospiraceae bacterium]|nr:SAM-dependent methyltransferase [Lachnospiraceae bacterium]
MEELKKVIGQIVASTITKMIISKPVTKNIEYKKIIIERKKEYFQAAKYTEKQVFHDNVMPEDLEKYLQETIAEAYLQVNAWDVEKEHILLISKKGKVTYKTKKSSNVQGTNAKAENGQANVQGVAEGQRADIAYTSHNRKKNYILEEGQVIPPLVDMGVFTKEGKVVKSMYDKFRQINRFIEMIDDGVRDYNKEEIHIIDFGCGKSYLTFIMYYYFTEVRHMKVQMLGLDLKEDVIRKCNETAQKYGYENLRFEMGDINGFKTPFDVDMVVTLHACDTATDFALYNAICWNAKMIFSVPCCQHELNKQMQTDDLSLLTRYGIVKERFAALTTDAVRANLLEVCGYKTQLLEFVDFAHTPKNILIRAIRKPVVPASVKKKYLGEVEAVMKEFHVTPTLYTLLEESGKL